jgi:hypothetical protein
MKTNKKSKKIVDNTSIRGTVPTRILSSATTSDSGAIINSNSITFYGWNVSGTGIYISSGGTTLNFEKKEGLNPILVFKYIKKNKMSLLGKFRYERRIKKIEKLANKYIKLGHNVFAEKFLKQLAEEVRLSEIRGAGIKMYVLKSIVDKHKNDIRGGHISDTDFDKYTNVIPDDILEKKKKIDSLKIFDKYVIYHYYSEKIEEKKEKKETISNEEKSAMRDPILFGVCSSIPDKLFFIDDWESDYDSLSFTDLIDSLKLEDEEVEIPDVNIDINN